MTVIGVISSGRSFDDSQIPWVRRFRNISRKNSGCFLSFLGETRIIDDNAYGCPNVVVNCNLAQWVSDRADECQESGAKVLVIPSSDLSQGNVETKQTEFHISLRRPVYRSLTTSHVLPTIKLSITPSSYSSPTWWL